MDSSGSKRRKPTQRAREEQALQDSEERFRTLLQFSFDVYWESDAQHRFTRQEFSDRLPDAPRHDSEIGKTRWEVPYLEPNEKAWREHRATMDAHLPFQDFQLARPTPDGGKRYVSVSGVPVFDDEGRFVGYRGVGRHVTEHKRVEAELRARQEMLDLAQNAARAVAFDWHIGVRESENRWSPELEAMYGLETGAFDRTFEGWKKLVHPDDWPEVKLAIKRAQHSGDVGAEYRVIHKDGSVHWLRAKGRIFFDAAGQPERMLGFMIDVTDWRQAEEELRASEVRFRTFVDQATDSFFLLDERLAVVDVNRQACESMGYRREELIGMQPGDFDAALDPASIDRLAERAGTGETVTFETLHRRKDGSVFPVEIRTATFPRGGRRFFLAIARDITERKRAEEEHRAHLRFLQSMDRVNRAIQGTDDRDTMISEVLRVALDTFACDRAWLVGPCDPAAPSWRAIMEHTRPQFPGAFALGEELPMDAEVAAAFAAAQASSGPVLFGSSHDLKVPPQAAKRFAIRSQIALALDAKGDRRQLFGLHQCSHDRVWTAEEQRLFQEIGRRLGDAIGVLSMLRSVRESERRLEAAQRIAHVGWWERDFTTKRVSLSDEAQRIFGVQPVDLPHWQDRWLTLIHPEDRAQAADASAAAMHGGPRYDVEYRVVRPDGAVRVVHSQGDVVLDEWGHPLRQFGVMQDVTELRRAEDELRASEAYLEEAQRLSHTGSWAFELASNKYVYTSDESDRIYGFDPNADPPTREAVFERIHPDDRSRWKQNFERSLREQVDVSDEYRIVLPDGSVRHIRAVRHPVLNSSGDVVQLVGSSMDITERKRAEDELRASESRFRTFVDHATDAFFLYDERLSIVDVNRHACESLGYSREELIGRHPRRFNVGPDESSIAGLAQRATAGEAVTLETLHRRKDGTTFPVEVRVRMFEQADQRYYLSLARDIGERKRAEETLREQENALQTARAELARASRVMLMGELTASIAHEVNQPLGAMVANAAACARWLAAASPELAKTQRALESIAADGRRASEVIGRIRALVKRQAPQMVRLDINHKIRDVVALTEHELRTNAISLELRLADDLSAVEGDRVQLQQVLLNLIVNAIEAMRAVDDRPRALTIVSSREGAEAVAVEVRDSGSGLDGEGAERLFEAFYTTKSEGIGIGLSISRSIVEAHGGALSAAPNFPHGAVFRIRLPVAGPG